MDLSVSIIQLLKPKFEDGLPEHSSNVKEIITGGDIYWCNIHLSPYPSYLSRRYLSFLVIG